MVATRRVITGRHENRWSRALSGTPAMFRLRCVRRVFYASGIVGATDRRSSRADRILAAAAPAPMTGIRRGLWGCDVEEELAQVVCQPGTEAKYVS